MANELKNELSETAEDLKEHLNLYLDLYRLKAAISVSRVLANALKVFIFMNLILITLIFASFAMAYYLESLFAIPGIGFAVIAAFFVVVMVALWLCRGALLDRPVIQSVIKLFFPKK